MTHKSSLQTIMVLIVVFGGAKSVMNSSFVGTEGLPSFVRFNNPALLSSDGDSAPFPFDTTQEDPDPLKLGGIRLRDEAKQFAVRLRRLSNEEIGITTMQVWTPVDIYIYIYI